jgi:hypothetical protein
MDTLRSLHSFAAKSHAQEPENQSALILYQTEDGRMRVQCRLDGETLWLKQAQIAELFKVMPQPTSLPARSHTRGGLPGAQPSGHPIPPVGHRPVAGVSGEGARDGQRADQEPAGQGPGQKDYFDELLDRIRDVCSSERRFYQKILDIYATSVDYTPAAEQSQRFFATVQNKIHWAAHGHTAAV